MCRSVIGNNICLSSNCWVSQHAMPANKFKTELREMHSEHAVNLAVATASQIGTCATKNLPSQLVSNFYNKMLIKAS